MSPKNKNRIRIAILTGLLLIPIFYAMTTAIDLQYSWLKEATYLMTVLVLLVVPALLLKARTYFLIEGICNFLFFPIDIVSLYLNRQSTSKVFLQNIFATNFSEAVELILSMWPLAIVVVILWVVYFVIACRVENTYLFPRKTVKWILVSGVTLVIAGVLSMIVLLTRLHSERSVGSTIEDAMGLAWMKLYKIYPYNLYLETADLIHDKHIQRQLRKQVASFRFGIKPRTFNEAEMYILVIGEAARYDHFGLNKYARNTTPLLAQKSNLISYDSAFSQANLTATSIPLITTRATADHPQLAYAEMTLPEAFREAGFKTGWITKQIPYAFVERAMANSDYSYFYSKGIDVDGNYDCEMIEQLRSFTEDTAQFFVLHSLGCHFRYEQRYPNDFALFQPVFGDVFSYSMISEENKDKLVNAYDNAILYTDYFLNQLIDYADSLNRPAVVMYMSDHGESFWDDERKLSLHGSYQVSEYEYHVPLFVWSSDEYIAKYPQKEATLRQNKTTPVSSDVVFYSLLDLAGVTDIVDSTRSICSPFLQRIDTFPVITGSGAVVQHSFIQKE